MPAKKRAFSPAKDAKKESAKRLGYITRALCSNSFTTGWSGRAGHALEGSEVFAGVYDGRIFEMLAAAAPEALGVPKSERDAYQASFVEMIGQALDAENKLLTKAVESAQADASKAEQAKTESESKAAALDASLEAKRADIAAKSEKLTADKEAVKTAEAAAAEAKKAKAVDDARVEGLQKKKAAFEQATADLAALKDPPTGEGVAPMDGITRKKLYGSVQRTLENFSEADVEEALSTAIPYSLKIPAEKRGPFDAMVFDHVSGRLQAELAKYQAIAPSAEAAAALAGAEAALEAAKATVTASEEALKTAETEEVEMKKEKKSTAQEAKHHGHEVKVNTEEHEKRHKVLTHFTEVRGMFDSQKVFEVPVEPEEAAPPAAPAAEAPAAA